VEGLLDDADDLLVDDDGLDGGRCTGDGPRETHSQQY